MMSRPKTPLQLGVVSFLNARPLIDGLEGDPNLALAFDVPARLADRLDAGEFDAALVPVFDVLRLSDRRRVISDACIACDGETMTVRVFSRVPPDRVRVLHADVDSHTSVNLARVLWRELFDVTLDIRPLDARLTNPADAPDAQAVLLIGDKVVDPSRGHFGYEVDLGGAWRQHTGLPFVFAVWAGAAPSSSAASPLALLAEQLSAARDRGVARAAEIADLRGPRHGWPVELARRYLCRCLRFTLDARMIEGANHFARLLHREGLLPREAELPCPEIRLTGAGAGT